MDGQDEADEAGDRRGLDARPCVEKSRHMRSLISWLRRGILEVWTYRRD